MVRKVSFGGMTASGLGPAGGKVLFLAVFFEGKEAFTALLCVEQAMNDVKTPDNMISFK
jgi:hypothetical protein